MMKRLIKATAFAVAVAVSGAAMALSPPGTPEYAAEMDAISQMRQYWGAYTVRTNDVQMRSNKLSITIPATNRIGNRVTFRSLVRKQVNRDGSVKYFAGRPEVAD